MDLYIDDYISQLQTPISVEYKQHDSAPTGHISNKLAEPIDALVHAHTFTLQGEGIVLTIPTPQVEITKEVDAALWKALDRSTTLVARGRLIT